MPSWPSASQNTQLPVGQLVSQLGQVTRREPDSGLVKFNTPLINTLLANPQGTIAPLNQFLGQAKQPLQVVEGLYLAQQLTDRVDKGSLSGIYATVAKRFNDSNDPLIQTYMAGFYRKLNEPAAFGPLMKMLMKSKAPSPVQKLGALPNGQWRYPDFDASEEIGGAMMSLVASQAAEKLYQKFYPGSKGGTPSV